MKKILLLAVAIVFCSTASFAQTSYLSGSWTSNRIDRTSETSIFHDVLHLTFTQTSTDNGIESGTLKYSDSIEEETDTAQLKCVGTYTVDVDATYSYANGVLIINYDLGSIKTTLNNLDLQFVSPEEKLIYAAFKKSITKKAVTNVSFEFKKFLTDYGRDPLELKEVHANSFKYDQNSKDKILHVEMHKDGMEGNAEQLNNSQQ